VIQEFLGSILRSRLIADWGAPDKRMSGTEPLPNTATTPFTGTGPRSGWDLLSKKIWPPVAQTASRVKRQMAESRNQPNGLS
jgi:hypothetical protein